MRRSYVRQLACIKPGDFREKGNFKNDAEIQKNYLALIFGWDGEDSDLPLKPSDPNWV